MDKNLQTINRIHQNSTSSILFPMLAFQERLLYLVSPLDGDSKPLTSHNCFFCKVLFNPLNLPKINWKPSSYRLSDHNSSKQQCLPKYTARVVPKHLPVMAESCFPKHHHTHTRPVLQGCDGRAVGPWWKIAFHNTIYNVGSTGKQIRAGSRERTARLGDVLLMYWQPDRRSKIQSVLSILNQTRG